MITKTQPMNPSIDLFLLPGNLLWPYLVPTIAAIASPIVKITAIFFNGESLKERYGSASPK